MNSEEFNRSLEKILEKYNQSFKSKIYAEEFLEEDELMLAFGITQKIKAVNKQYWGRELGMCWELLTKKLCQQTCGNNFREPIDKSHDFIVNQDAIDAKYRIGSGDAKTLRAWRTNAQNLIQQNYTPILLILRQDNLVQAVNACKAGGWIIKSGDDAYQYIDSITDFDLKSWLEQRKNSFPI